MSQSLHARVVDRLTVPGYGRRIDFRPEMSLLFRIVFVASALLLAACQSGSSGSSGPGAVGALSLEYRETEAASDPRYAGIVVEAESGKVLYAESADAPRYPASLAKMMTLYLLFEELKTGRLRLDSPLAVSAAAAAQPPSKLGLRAGSTIRVADAIPAVAVKSANDVAAVVAENIAGSEAAFAARMTSTARRLGMRSTTFRNASGLPDPAQVTTALDMAVLAAALQQHFPEQYRIFGTRAFSYGGKTYKSTNHLLGQVEGMDGMKTGYTRASGFNLATSVRRDGRRVNIVVMGTQSGAARSAQVAALVEAYAPARRTWLASRE